MLFQLQNRSQERIRRGKRLIAEALRRLGRL